MEPSKTSADRVRALRQRRQDAGFVRLEVYAHPDDHAALKAQAARLQAARERAAKRR